MNIYENPHLSADSLAGVSEFWTGPYQGLYIPVTYTVWSWLALHNPASVSRGAGPEPVTAPLRYHLANLLLHLASVLLVFLLFQRLFEGEHFFAAAAGAALFAIHPLQVEAVAWATGLKDLLSAFLALLAIHQFLSFIRSERSFRRWCFYAASLTFFLLAVFAKPQITILPAILAALLYFFHHENDLRTARANAAAYASLFPFFGLALGAIALTAIAAPSRDAYFPFDAPPLHLRSLVALDALSFYAAKFLWPLDLAVDYGRTPASVLTEASRPQLFVLPFLAVVLLFAIRHHRRYYLAGAAIAFLALLPVLGIIPFPYQGQSTVADRYAYFALAGIGLLFAAAVAHSPGRLPRICATLLLLVLATVSSRQVSHWQNTETLLTRTLAINPASVPAHYNLGIMHLRDGQPDRAIARFEKAIALREDFYPPWVNIAYLHIQARRYREAVACLEKAIALAPGYPGAWLNLGFARAGLNENEAAVTAFAEALDLNPRYPEALAGLALAQNALGQATAARTSFQEALTIARESPACTPAQLHKLEEAHARFEPPLTDND